jgi:hypothetical protein
MIFGKTGMRVVTFDVFPDLEVVVPGRGRGTRLTAPKPSHAGVFIYTLGMLRKRREP